MALEKWKWSGFVSRRSVYRSSVFSLEGGLDGLPLRVSNEGLLSPHIS